MLEVELQNEAATKNLARLLAAVLEPRDVVGLEGGLGAGKTTFVREVVHGLDVPEQTAVTSPTFALLHRYEGRHPIGHADLYRLAEDLEIDELGLDDLLEEGAVLFVEWGRKFPTMVERTTLFVELEIVSEVARRARLVPTCARGDAIIGALRRALSG